MKRMLWKMWIFDGTRKSTAFGLVIPYTHPTWIRSSSPWWKSAYLLPQTTFRCLDWTDYYLFEQLRDTLKVNCVYLRHSLKYNLLRNVKKNSSYTYLDPNFSKPNPESHADLQYLSSVFLLAVGSQVKVEVTSKARWWACWWGITLLCIHHFTLCIE